ncbi:MAG: sulfatase, partial [Bacteroidota bacterium]
SPQFIGCYGNEVASTPVIDQLAEEGVRFTNAFSTGTVCSPSRSTIITGARTFAMGTGNHRSNFPIPDFIKGFPYYMRKQGYYTTNNSKRDYNLANLKEFTNTAWNESSNQAGWWDRKAGQPFFAVFNFNESHQSRTMTHAYDWYLENVLEKLPEGERIKKEDFEMPPFYKDTPAMRKQFARVYNSIKLTDNRIGDLLEKLEADKLRDSTIIFFYADHGEGIPRGKTNGINLGYRVPFIIWFPEMYKHLSPWGTAGIVSDELITFEDLAPTLVHLAGGEIPDHLEGRILMGKQRSETVNHLVLSSDRADNGIDMVRSITDGRYFYSRNFMPFIPQQRYIRYMEIADILNEMRSDLGKGVLTPLQESIFHERPAEFLFDIKNDIWEETNLVDDPSYNEVLVKMRKQLDRSVLNRKDIHFLPEYELAEVSKTETPYTFRLDKKKYPLGKVYKTAQLAGKQDTKTIKRQIKLLTHRNKVLRYWAIIGLRSQTAEGLKDYHQNLLDALEDPYPPVAITAASMVYEQFGNDKASNVLKRYCQSDNFDLALMVINYLLYMDDKAPFIKTVQRVYDMPDRNYNVKAACLDFLGILEMVPNDFEHRN